MHYIVWKAWSVGSATMRTCVSLSCTELILMQLSTIYFHIYRQHGSEIYGVREGLFAFAFAAQRASKLRALLNGNCVLRSTEIVCFSQRASLNSNCVLLATKIVSFAQRKLCASPNALRPTEIVCFAQRASLKFAARGALLAVACCLLAEVQ